MEFETKLKRYAKLLVTCGMAVQKGQLVHVSAEVYHREFALLVAEEAYLAGARYVNLDLIEPRLARHRTLHSQVEDLQYTPPFFSVKYKELVDYVGANISIVGSEDPDLLSDLNPMKVNTQRIARYNSLKYFYDEGIGKNKVHWCVAAAATPKWGEKIFKDLSPEEAEKRLWEEIFSICRVDGEGYLEKWRHLNGELQERARKLTDLHIETLHFTGPGTDLKVGLSKEAVFKGGGEKSSRGVEYQPNIPTEECFTTPDNSKTEGVVRCTRPFIINGKLVKGVSLSFERGEITGFEAEEGSETFREYIHSDPGGKRLGEVALVGVDSPVYQSGHIFEEILFDENAACHIAVGSAYKFCIEGGDSMTGEELEKIGFNESSVHTDMMISSEEVRVTAHTYSGEKISLLTDGKWARF
ncbi:MAG: aminopeptidase [Nitrospinota bacterium]